jgi:metal-dependent amidase/aminoacylase/carboxypeptidase family protein|tara:strand:+ start:916 stop:2199 length:1284 start_codon:yes stop_codon:yes gene_type:complete
MKSITSCTFHVILLCALALISFKEAGAAENALIHQQIQQKTAAMYSELVAVRNDLHQHPELSGEEQRTANKIAASLTALGLNVIRDIGGHSVIGVLNTGKPGKSLAWRADIDAIPTAEGIGHNCGHDIHTTIALGMAEVLHSLKSQLTGKLIFVFQPAEETYTGAIAMLDEGFLTAVQPDEFYAAHISPKPAGLVASKAGYLYADYRQVNLVFNNVIKPEATITPAKQSIASLQSVAKESPFWNTANLMDPTIGLGHPNTIYQNYVVVENRFDVEHAGDALTVTGYVSASNGELMQLINKRLRQKIANNEFAASFVEVNNQATQLTYSLQRGNINNTAQLTEQSLQSMAKVYDGRVLKLYGVIPDGRSDDFAYFQQHIPGTYFLLSGSDFSKGVVAMPHAPNFAVDERVIEYGVNYFSSLLVERLGL